MSDPTRAEAAAYRSAARGTLGALHAAVKERLAILVTDFWQFSTRNAERAPLIFDGWLPPKKSPVDQAASAGNEQYPFLLVRPRTGVDSEQSAAQNATATIEIVIGTFSDDDDGWLDVLHLIEAIRGDLGAAPTIQGTAFEHTGPLTWEVLEEQPRPQWLGRVTTIWTIPRPRRVEARDAMED